ncbi:TPA: hypothetical protein ENX78_11520 [Candidatus Poribacteria bacterium]|nr:hypothetical protein [Candidatus Poribacteria bacterium]
MKEMRLNSYNPLHNILVLTTELGAGLYWRVVKPFQRILENDASFLNYDVFYSIEPLRSIDLSKYDIILFQRVIGQEIAIELWNYCRKNGKILIYEIDDFLLGLPLGHPDYSLYNDPNVQRRLIYFLSTADYVTVSTDILRQKLLAYQENIQVLPNLLDDRIWNKTPPPCIEKDAPIINIGFFGTPSHHNDLLIAEEALLELGNKYQDQLQIYLIGCTTKKLKALPNAIFLPFDLDYRRSVQRFQSLSIHIALAPLIDNEFNHCKSNIKWLEYSIAGAAGVFSDIPTYNSSIISYSTGVLAKNSSDEWYRAIESLIINHKQRKLIVQAAQQEIESKYTLSKGYSIFREFYEYLDKLKKTSRSLGQKSYQEHFAKAQTTFRRFINNRNAYQKFSKGTKFSILYVSQKPLETFEVDVIVPIENLSLRYINNLHSIYHTLKDKHHLILIFNKNNQTNDQTDQLLEKFFYEDRVTIIQSSLQIGKSQLIQTGVDFGKSPYVLIINSEIEIDDFDWIDKLIPIKEDVGVMGCKLVYADQQNPLWAGKIYHIGIARNHKGEPYPIFRGWPAKTPETMIYREVNAVGADCLLTRRKIWEEVGGFDLDFTSSAEVDYCWAVRRAGYRIIYCPEVKLSYRGEINPVITKRDIQKLIAKWGLQQTDEDLYLTAGEFNSWQKARKLLEITDYMLSTNITSQAVTLAPRLAEAWSAHGKMLALLNYREEAERAFLQNLNLEPCNFQPYYNLSKLYYEMGQIEKASSYIGLALTLNDHQKDLLQTATLIADRAGDHGLTIHILERIIREFPSDFVNIVSQRPNLFPVATQFLDDLLIKEPKNIFLHAIKAQVELSKGNLEKALIYFQHFHKEKQFWEQQVCDLISQSKYEDANNMIEIWQNHIPDDMEAQRMLAKLWVESDREQDGFRLYKQLEQYFWNHPDFLLEFIEYAISRNGDQFVYPLIEKLCQVQLNSSERFKLQDIIKKYPQANFMRLFLTLTDHAEQSITIYKNSNTQSTYMDEEQVFTDLNNLLDELLAADDLDLKIEQFKSNLTPQFIQFIRQKSQDFLTNGNSEIAEGLNFLSDYLESKI